MEWAILFLVLAVVCFGTWLYIRSESRAEDENTSIQTMVSGINKTSLYKLPSHHHFDEPLIQAELARLASEPRVFWQYVHQLRAVFTKYNQVKVIDKYIGYYRKASELVETDTKLKRALIEQQNLNLESTLARSKLEADIEEQKTRRAKSVHERGALRPNETTSTPKSEDERKFEQKRSKRFIDIEDKLFEQLELATYEDLASTKLHRKLTLDIDRNPELTEEEKYEARQRLNARFDEKRKDVGLSIYAEDD